MKSLGQIAYEAFGESLRTTYVMFPWEQVGPQTQAAWEASADAITAALLKKPAEFAV